MRIISGKLKGRQFQSPHGHRTHPMSEKVRGAIFNVLGDIEGLTILDAFAGSGSLAFEAASRGAKSVIAIDKDTSAHRTIEQNVKVLDLQGTVHATKANAAGWSANNMEKEFDILLLDPPFDDLQTALLDKLIRSHVKGNGLAVLNYPGNLDPPEFEDCETAARKNYGDTKLIFYRKLR